MVYIWESRTSAAIRAARGQEILKRQRWLPSILPLVQGDTTALTLELSDDDFLRIIRDKLPGHSEAEYAEAIDVARFRVGALPAPAFSR